MSNRAASATQSTLAIIKAQLVFLLSTLTEESYSRNEREINALIEQHGTEATAHLLKRLVIASAPALEHNPSANPQAQLTLRLLISTTKKLARDPLLAHRFREAILSGLNDTSSGSSSSEAFRTLGENLDDFSDRAGFNGLERLILGLEMVRVLILPNQTNQNTPSARSALALHAKCKEFGIAAYNLIRNAWSVGIEGLAAGQGSDVIGPVALSRLTERVCSDWMIDTEHGEFGIWDEGRGVPLFDIEQKRAFVRALRARVNHQIATQVALHSLESMEFAPQTTTISILHRLVPDHASCSPELVRAVIHRHGQFPSPPSSPASEQRITAFLSDLFDLAARFSPNSAGSPEIGIDPSVLVRVLSEHLPPGASWASLIRFVFDNPDRKPVNDVWSVKLLYGLLASSANASSALWTDWDHKDKQLTLLDRLVFVLAPEGAPTLSTLPEARLVVSPSDVAGTSTSVRNLFVNSQTSSWNSADLIKTLIKLSNEDALRGNVADMLERGSKVAPELICIGLAMIEKPWNTLHTALASRLLSGFLGGVTAHQLVFHRLWQIDRAFVLAALRDFYAESELNIGRVVDIGQELHILQEILELRPFRLALDAAALASRREFLELARWLQTSIARHGAPFVKEALAFVGSKVRYELQRNAMDPPPEPTTLPLIAPAVAIFMRALRMNYELFTAEDVDAFKEVRSLSLQLHPRLLNFGPGAEQEPGMVVASFPPEIEAEVDATFKRMYEQEFSVEDIVQILQRARDGGDLRRIEFFQCMLHGLMDEMRWVATYPPQELLMTAYLFGSLIQHKVFERIPLGIAVRYVLDALRHPPNAASYRFGINALARFQTRLQEWPQLAQAILNIPHVAVANPEIAAYARAVLTDPGSLEPMAIQNGALDRVAAAEEVVQLPFTAISPSPSYDQSSQIEPPDEDASDKILFIINNLAPSNVTSKVAEMNEKLKESHFRWLANYLVAQRVCIEPNNHSLYLDFLDALAQSTLNEHVLQESYVKSATLLNSEKTVQSSTERTLLKNLGAWLGAITLARNRPIKHKNLSFKDLLVQGYDSGRLIAAIPFVCKILEQASKSRVFKPPNPWLMAIVRLLVELYHHAELKLNLKFEIEVLFKSLNLDLKDVEPSHILRSRPGQQEAADSSFSAQPTPNLLHERDSSAPGFSGPASGRNSAAQMLSGQPGYSVGLQESIASALQSLANFIVINPQLSYIAANPALKRAVHVAIDSAVREVIAPVVERSVTIAGISTRELTAKDFAMEGDEDTLRKSAHLMVQNLAGSLALVTCKEPLRLSIMNHLRTLFIQQGYSEHNLPEQAIGLLAAENLEAACAIVERVAMEKAIIEVDEGLAPAYHARRKHRERSTAAFWDTSAMAASHYSGMLPDPLRLKLNGLSQQQLQVYEDFGRKAEADDDLMLTVQQAVDKFCTVIGDVDKLLATEQNLTVEQLASNEEIALALAQLPALASRSSHADETALACSQKVVQLLYRANSDAGREVYATLLQRLCSLSEKVLTEVVAWLVYAEDERKFHVTVTVTLIRHRVIPVATYEAQLATFVARDFRASAVDYAARLVRRLLSEQPPLATRDQLAHLIDALVMAARADKSTDASAALLHDLSLTPANSRSEIEAQEIREQLTLFFVQWVRIFQQSATLEKSFVDYVVQLQEHGVLKGEDLSSRFFRTCTEVSIDSYIKQKAAGGTIQSGIFQPVDALGALIAFMLKYHGDGTSDKGAADAKAFYLTKVLSIVVLVLAQSHEDLGAHFAVAQKPFFRLLSSLISNLHGIEAHLGPAYTKILISLTHSINTLQPLYFPGFAFSWVSLISHRLLMPKLLRTKEGQAAFNRLLLSLFRFLDPLLKQGPLTDSVRALYTATSKILLVLLHDAPDYMASYYPSLCDAIPASCLQLQNIVLAAFPADASLADPFATNVYEHAGFQKAPTIAVDFSAPLAGSVDLQRLVDSILRGDTAPTAITAYKSLLYLPVTGEKNDSHRTYSRKMVTSLVMTCMTACVNTSAKPFDAEAPGFKLAVALLADLDPEGRYHLVSSLANQLRYPNSHTLWASQCILHIFGAQGTDQLTKEIIVRVLLERMCSMRPHPFGLVLTQIELLRRFRIEEEGFFSKPELKPLLAIVDRMRSKI